EQVRDTAVQEVVSAYNDLKTSLEAYAAAVAVREATQTAYDSAFDSYVHGVGSYTEVATEQTSLVRADAETADAHANAFTAAAARRSRRVLPRRMEANGNSARTPVTRATPDEGPHPNLRHCHPVDPGGMRDEPRH